MDKNREILFEVLQDMEDFAQLKNIDYPPIYLLGGSGCIVAGYLNRATTDLDFLDMDYQAKMGRLFRILDRFDMLDIYLTTISLDFKDRVVKINEFKNIFVLSKEDIITSKLGRYSEKDKEDIDLLMKNANKDLILELIMSVEKRDNIGFKVKQAFLVNTKSFKERYYV